MTMREFIKANREALREHISRAIGHVPATASCDCSLSGTDHYHKAEKFTDSDIGDWVLNDESLYNWARSEGVRI